MLLMSPAFAARLARESRKRERQRLRMERAQLVKALALVMRAARDNGTAATLFRFEGQLIALVRSEGCMVGVTWSLADAFARGVVEEALDALGAERPSHEEGQPAFTGIGPFVERTRCANCGARVEGGRTFCSQRCAQAAWARRHYHEAREAARLAAELRERRSHASA